MARSTRTTTSARSAACGWCAAAIFAGLVSALLSPHSASETVPPALVISLTQPSPLSGAEIIEFQLAANDQPGRFLLLVGSLADAGSVESIRLESTPISQGRAQSLVLNRTKPTALPSGIQRRTTRKSAISSSDSTVILASHPSAAQPITGGNPRERVFFLQLESNPNSEASYQPVQARLAAESARLRIWEDVRCEPPPTRADLNWMVRSLEEDLLPKISELFGEISDLDADGKLSICLTPRLAELPAAGSPVEGLVQFNDFLTGLRRPFSNQADVVFLSASLRPGRHATAILAHETAHLAVFSRRQEIDPAGAQLEDDWLNEGLAHYAEFACGGDWSNLQTRIDAFSRNPATSPLVVMDAQRQGLWRHPGARGACWAFLSWLAEEYGPELLTELAQEPGVGCAKLEQILQQPFSEVFRQWTLALWQVSSRTEICPESQFRRGMNQAGGHSLMEWPPDQTKAEISLRGSSQAGFRLTIPPRNTSAVRIIGARQSRLQVTVVDLASDPPAMWIVK